MVVVVVGRGQECGGCAHISGFIHKPLPTRVVDWRFVSLVVGGGFHPTFQGIVICILCGFFATNVSPVKKEEDIERVLKVGWEDKVGLDVWEVSEPSGHAMAMPK